MAKNYQAILAIMLILFIVASPVFSGPVYAQEEQEDEGGVPIVSDILDIVTEALSIPLLTAAGLTIGAAQTVGDVVGIIGKIGEVIDDLFGSDPEEACEEAANLYNGLYGRAMELADERERLFQVLGQYFDSNAGSEEERAGLIEQINQLNAVIDSIVAELNELEQFLRLRCPEQWIAVENNIRELDEERERERERQKWFGDPPPAMPASWPENFDDLKSQIEDHLIRKAMWWSGKILPADYGRNNIHRLRRDLAFVLLDLKDTIGNSTNAEEIHNQLQEAKQEILNGLGLEETASGEIQFPPGPPPPYYPNPYEEGDPPNTPELAQAQIEALLATAQKFGWEISEVQVLTQEKIEQIARRLTELYLEIAKEVCRELNVLINLTAERSGIREETRMPEQAGRDQIFATRDLIIPFGNTKGLLKSLRGVVIYPSKAGKETITVKVNTRGVQLEGQTTVWVRKNQPYILKLKFPSGMDKDTGLATVALENTVFVPVKQVENYKKLLDRQSFIAKIKRYFGGEALATSPRLMLFENGYLAR